MGRWRRDLGEQTWQALVLSRGNLVLLDECERDARRCSFHNRRGSQPLYHRAREFRSSRPIRGPLDVERFPCFFWVGFLLTLAVLTDTPSKRITSIGQLKRTRGETHLILGGEERPGHPWKCACCDYIATRCQCVKNRFTCVLQGLRG